MYYDLENQPLRHARVSMEIPVNYWTISAATLCCLSVSATTLLCDRHLGSSGTALYGSTTVQRHVSVPMASLQQSSVREPVAVTENVALAEQAEDFAAGQTNHSMLPPVALLTASLSAVALLFKAVQARPSPPSRHWAMANTGGLSQDELKKLVGYKAVDDHVRSGMVVGLGTGSTAAFAVERVGQKLKAGELKNIICIPTSERTREQAEALGIPLCTLNEKSHIDVSIDGADEVDPDWNLVKGGGGALLREKMVEIVSDKFICIVDESKLCKGLGPGFPLPVEITPFCHEHTMRVVAALPAIKPYLKEAVLRMGSSSTNKRDGDNIAVTDNGNYIVDLHFKETLKDAPAAAAQLKSTVGVVDHGLFIGMATEVIVAGKEGVYVLPRRK
eukprot:EG_transcript_15619